MRDLVENAFAGAFLGVIGFLVRKAEYGIVLYKQLENSGSSPRCHGAGGGGRTHMLSEERGILSPVRLPVPPLQRVRGAPTTTQV